MDEKRFRIGDKIKAIEFDRKNYGYEWVTITSIDEENKIYHWEIEWGSGTLVSGYPFSCSVLYENETHQEI